MTGDEMLGKVVATPELRFLRTVALHNHHINHIRLSIVYLVRILMYLECT